MMEIQNAPAAVLIGGDHRMVHTASRLSEAGYTVTLWGQGGDASLLTATDLPSHASLLILPIPATRDGLHLNAPLSPRPIPLNEVLTVLKKGQTVASGTLPDAVADAIRSKGCRIYDYQTDENFALWNALATAEGAIAIAIQESGHLLSGSEVAVIGFGRIAKQLCRLLTGFGAKITVLARKETDRTLAETLGYRALPLSDTEILSRAALIFHTVPVRLYDYAHIDPPINAPVIDLAPIYEPSDRPKVIRAAALPSRYAPAFAGRLIADCVLAHLKEVNGQ